MSAGSAPQPQVAPAPLAEEKPIPPRRDEAAPLYSRAGSSSTISRPASSTTPSRSRFPGIKFCPECANMLYPKLDKETMVLLNACRQCPFQEPCDNPCIFYNAKNQERSVDQELAAVNVDLVQDPTLPRTNSIPCPKCMASDVVFLGTEKDMKIIYICKNNNCLHKWTE